jgi:hypothetical protein
LILFRETSVLTQAGKKRKIKTKTVHMAPQVLAREDSAIVADTDNVVRSGSAESVGVTGAVSGTGSEVGTGINVEYDDYPPSEEFHDPYKGGGVDDIYKERPSSMQYSNNPMVTNPMFRNPMQGSRTASRTPVAPVQPIGSSNADHIDGFDEEDLSSSAQQQSR